MKRLDSEVLQKMTPAMASKGRRGRGRVGMHHDALQGSRVLDVRAAERGGNQHRIGTKYTNGARSHDGIVQTKRTAYQQTQRTAYSINEHKRTA